LVSQWLASPSIYMSIYNSLDLWCHRSPVQVCYDFYLGRRDRQQNKVFAAEIILKEVSPATFNPASFQLDPDAAQALMDTMWQSGLRPSDGTASTGQLKATENHLADMKKLLYGVLTQDFITPRNGGFR
jgi:hypothetical protein